MIETKTLRRLLLLVGALLLAMAHPSLAVAQDEGEEEPPPPPPQPPPQPRTGGGANAGASFDDNLSMLTAPGPAGTGIAGANTEIFPDASKVWMSVRDVNPIPIESARRGGKWICAGGQCAAKTGKLGQSLVGDRILRSIKLQTPALPLPLTIWGRSGTAADNGKLYFDPVLLGRRSYAHVCAYKPSDSGDAKAPANKPGDKVPICPDGQAQPPAPDSAEVSLGMEWPKESEMADFRYLAIVDSCGNARVQPFQRTFTVPVFEVASGGCGKPDGKVLRIFPQGGWIRVTAFNLDSPATDNVVNVTYRVNVPALENNVEANPAKLLFPDLLLQDLQVDCGPALRKPPTDLLGAPAAPPGAKMPSPPAPPGKGGAPPGKGDPKDKSEKDGPPSNPAPPPMAERMPPPAPKELPASGPGAQALSHGAVVIAPEPLKQGNCRIRLQGQTKRRLVAPLALFVRLTRTDITGQDGSPVDLLPESTREWIITPSNPEFQIPPLSAGFDGDSRLRLVVSSDPLSPDGKVVLLSDSGRIASALAQQDGSEERRKGARRMVGSVTIHSVPLCGESNFETLEAAGSCLRAYLTVPAMLATVQITRAPWVERPLVTRRILSAIGIALAIDSYDPVERKAFPVAAQVGGFVQTLEDSRVGLLGYVGLAPTLPVLGQGGNTTSLGFLAGIGLEYITNQNGPDEGVKPAAFLSFVVQVGQANPATQASGKASFGTYAGE